MSCPPPLPHKPREPACAPILPSCPTRHQPSHHHEPLPPRMWCLSEDGLRTSLSFRSSRSPTTSPSSSRSRTHQRDHGGAACINPNHFPRARDHFPARSGDPAGPLHHPPLAEHPSARPGTRPAARPIAIRIPDRLQLIPPPLGRSCAPTPPRTKVIPAAMTIYSSPCAQNRRAVLEGTSMCGARARARFGTRVA